MKRKTIKLKWLTRRRTRSKIAKISISVRMAIFTMLLISPLGKSYPGFQKRLNIFISKHYLLFLGHFLIYFLSFSEERIFFRWSIYDLLKVTSMMSWTKCSDLTRKRNLRRVDGKACRMRVDSRSWLAASKDSLKNLFF